MPETSSELESRKSAGDQEPTPEDPRAASGNSDNGATSAASPARAEDRHQPTTQSSERSSNQETGGESHDGSADGKSGVAQEEEQDESDGEVEEEEDEDDDDEDDEEEEPKLKYARLTQHVSPVYRNGDATSSFLVAGDKMVMGTHNGNIHVIQLPIFQTLRVYHAHSATVTSLSISPYPPPVTTIKPDQVARLAAEASNSPARPSSHRSEAAHSPARKAREMPAVPNIPSNNIYIATSSMDGNVCVQSLSDMKDVQLRNFARPVQAVALSPDYKNDRTYLSGGLAGNLILTVGGSPGRSTSTTIGTAAATASGWLGSVGLSSNTGGKDTILHSGEGPVSAIKWSLSGKYVVWLNEHGIKIMRTKLHLDSADADDAWKRIGHIDRPQTEEWDAMASVWKGRPEWIDDDSLETDDDGSDIPKSLASQATDKATDKLKHHHHRISKKVEKLIVGWGSTVWIIHVHPGSIGVGKHAGEKSLGRAEIVRILRMDCIISGISLYTQNLLLVLAFCLPEDDGESEVEATPKGHKSKPSTASSSSEPSGGIRRRQNNQPPELRLIDLATQAEVDKDGLSVSRYERLTASDYHLGILPARTAAAAVSSKGALEAIAGFSTDMWNAATNPRALFSSAASVQSKDSNDAASGSKAASTSGSLRVGQKSSSSSVHPNLAKPGVKIFIHSPYDCILATKRDLGDHLGWLLEQQQYENAWELVDEHAEILTSPDTLASLPTLPTPTPDKASQTQSSDDFYEDSVADAASRAFNSAAEREKRRIGELWLKELVDAGSWQRAGEIAGKVLGTADRWDKWVWTFAGANKFDDITDYIPAEPLRPPINRAVYEVVLSHYLQSDKPKFKDLLERWSVDLFDVGAVISELENQLKYRDVREDSIDEGEKGRDWRIVMESLAKLHEASGRLREALKSYIRLQDADSAFRLIKDGHLAEAVTDDIPGFITLRVPADQADRMTSEELEEATMEAITLLVDEAQHGLVKPDVVISQLQDQELNLYTFFYLRGLWRGEGIQDNHHEFRDRLVLESKALLDDVADLSVHLFAVFDRSLLMDFLKTSTSYSFEKAVEECEHMKYVDELVYLYSKTGETKRALYLIIDRLADVSRAITFAKEQDDPDLWEDLLHYSMDKPRFIRGLLEEVGTAIDPITLVRRIPEGLEIPGLREGLKHIMKEHEIQYSISSGVARVLRSEVAAAQGTLRSGQRKAIKFEVAVKGTEHVDVQARDVPTIIDDNDSGIDTTEGSPPAKPDRKWKPGHCAQCLEPFDQWETITLVGFACGHVFHADHLLEMIHPGQKVDIDFGAGSEALGRRNVVGTKVTHARLLKDRIREGCPVCLKRTVGV